MAAQSFSEETLINMTYLNLSKQTDAFTTEILQLWPEVSYEANANSTDHFLSLPLPAQLSHTNRQQTRIL